MDYIDYLIYLDGSIPAEFRFPLILGFWVIILATVVLGLFKLFTYGDHHELPPTQDEELLKREVRRMMQGDGMDDFSVLERKKTPPRGKVKEYFLRSVPRVSIEGIESARIQDLVLRIDRNIEKWESNDRVIRTNSKNFLELGKKLWTAEKLKFQSNRVTRLKVSNSGNISKESGTSDHPLSQSPIFQKKSSNMSEELLIDDDSLSDVEEDKSVELKINSKLSLDQNEEDNGDELIIGGFDSDDLNFDNNFLGSEKLVLPDISKPITEENDNNPLSFDDIDLGDALNKMKDMDGIIQLPSTDGKIIEEEEESDDGWGEMDDEEDDPFADIDMEGFKERTNAENFDPDQMDFLKSVYEEIPVAKVME